MEQVCGAGQEGMSVTQRNRRESKTYWARTEISPQSSSQSDCRPRKDRTKERAIQARRFWFVQKKLGWPGGIEFIAASLAIAVIFHPGLANAQSLEPRAYSNTPVGMNFLMLGYAYQEGDVLLDPSAPLKDVSAEIHSPVLAYVRSLDVWGKSGKVDIIVPYAWLSASGKVGGEARDRKVSGFADPAVRFSVNLYGAPALSFEEFKSYRQDTIVGVSLQVTAPLGQYDSDKLVNIGTNRWSFKPEVGISKALGRWTLETAAGATLYTKNDDFFGGNTRAQDPIFSVQGHLLYHFPRGIWAALNATYYAGGRTRVNGVEGDDLQRNWRMGATLALPVTLRHSVKLYASTGAYSRAGGDFDLIGIAWQYRWGGGL